MNRKARHKARCAGMQAIYQWHITNASIEDVLLEKLDEEQSKRIDRDYFRRLVTGFVEDQAAIDALISPLAARPFDDISPLELAILRLAVFELKSCLDTPYRVVLNEAIEIAKKYAAEDSHKFINGILDKTIPILRAAEVDTEQSRD